MIKKILKLLRFKNNNPESKVEFTIFEQATHFAKNGDYLRSAKFCEEILDVSPEADYYFQLLKHCYFEIGDIDRYLAALTRQRDRDFKLEQRDVLDNEALVINAAYQINKEFLVSKLIEINLDGSFSGWEFYKLAHKCFKLAGEESAAQIVAQGQFFAALRTISDIEQGKTYSFLSSENISAGKSIHKCKRLRSGSILQDGFSVALGAEERKYPEKLSFGDAMFLWERRHSFTESDELKDSAVLVANLPWGNEFAHWVFEVLPRLIWSNQNSIQVDKILLRQVDRWHLDYLSYLGIDKSKIFVMEPNTLYKYRTAYVFEAPVLTYPSYTIPKQAVETLRHSLQNFGKLSQSNAPNKIFINRKRGMQRNLIND